MRPLTMYVPEPARGSSILIDLFTACVLTRPVPPVKKLMVHDSGDFMEIANGNLCAGIFEERKKNSLQTLETASGLTLEASVSTWMAFGGNTGDLGSFGEETDKTTTLHQIHEEVVHIEWRRRREFQATTLGRLK
ncbi:hypothetical protein Tco_0518233 [Tanacetum coccineum]